MPIFYIGLVARGTSSIKLSCSFCIFSPPRWILSRKEFHAKAQRKAKEDLKNLSIDEILRICLNSFSPWRLCVFASLREILFFLQL